MLSYISLKPDVFKLAKNLFGWKIEAHVIMFRLLAVGHILYNSLF